MNPARLGNSGNNGVCRVSHSLPCTKSPVIHACLPAASRMPDLFPVKVYIYPAAHAASAGTAPRSSGTHQKLIQTSRRRECVPRDPEERERHVRAVNAPQKSLSAILPCLTRESRAASSPRWGSALLIETRFWTCKSLHPLTKACTIMTKMYLLILLKYM